MGAVVSAVTSPITATVSAAVNTVKAVATGDVGGAAKAAAGGVISAVSSPVAIADNLTGNKAAAIFDKVPIVGGIASQNLNAIRDVNSGNYGGVGQYLQSVAKGGAVYLGGGAIGSALGVGGLAGGAIAGNLVNRNYAGAVGGAIDAAGNYVGDYIPPDVSSAFNDVQNYLPNMSSGSGYRSPASASPQSFALSAPVPVGSSSISPVLIAVGVIGLILIFRRKFR